MKLLIDIGNSRLKWAIEQYGIISSSASVDYRQSDYLPALQADWQRLPAPAKVLVASVAADMVSTAVLQLAVQLWSTIPISLAATSAAACGVTNAYAQPEKLGVDRWLAMLAAHHHYPGPCCIADCGTAITIDIINAAGQHLGGLISPGLLLMKKSLAANTAALPFSSGAQQLLLADSTAAAIDSGVLFAAVGAIEAVYARLDLPGQLLLTGGDAAAIAAQLQLPVLVDDQLVFKGLSLFAAHGLTDVDKPA